MGTRTDWQTLLKTYEAAVSDFERLSAALGAALNRYPLAAEFLELISAEERARETVLLARSRLLRHWQGNLDDTIPLRVLNPDHICDRNGPTERVIDETGDQPITGLFPTCSVCGVPQTFPAAHSPPPKN